MSSNLDKVYEELEALRNRVIKMDLKYSETTEILSLILKIEKECDKAEREEETIINSPCYTCPFDCDTTCEIYKRWLWKTEENEEEEKLIKDLQKNQKLLPMGHYGHNQK